MGIFLNGSRFLLEIAGFLGKGPKTANLWGPFRDLRPPGHPLKMVVLVVGFSMGIHRESPHQNALTRLSCPHFLAQIKNSGTGTFQGPSWDSFSLVVGVNLAATVPVEGGSFVDGMVIRLFGSDDGWQMVFFLVFNLIVTECCWAYVFFVFFLIYVF